MGWLQRGEHQHVIDMKAYVRKIREDFQLERKWQVITGKGAWGRNNNKHV